MKLAVYIDPNGALTSLQGPGTFVVFEKRDGEWCWDHGVPFSMPPNAGLSEMKQTLAALATQLVGVRAVITTELRGIVCATISSMGIGVWRSEGEVFEQLTLVELAIAREKDVPPPEPQKCGGSGDGSGGRCGGTRRHRSCNCIGC